MDGDVGRKDGVDACMLARVGASFNSHSCACCSYKHVYTRTSCQKSGLGTSVSPCFLLS
jgi:hypothetical protein